MNHGITERPFSTWLFIILLLLSMLGCGVIGFIENPASLTGPSYWAAATGAPQSTPYYRIGTFYMESDVYVGGPDGLMFRLTQHDTQTSSHNEKAVYHFLTIEVTNYTAEGQIVPVSDLFFLRRVVDGEGQVQNGRWVTQNEPLNVRQLPTYDAQQLTPIQPDETRTFYLGFVVPHGELPEVGLITNWNQPVEGGLPIWFYLETDPDGPFEDAYKPPLPTSILLDSDGTYGNDDTLPTDGEGRWPTTGVVTRGFGCHELYTGINGAGFGCPAERPWFHNGVDIANVPGTLIWSPVEGSLTYSGPDASGADCSWLSGSLPPHEGLGNYQRLGNSTTTHYFGHLRTFLLTSGAVGAGQVVAEMGSTGCSTGSHLHWIMYQNGNLIDPAVWAGPGPAP